MTKFWRHSLKDTRTEAVPKSDWIQRWDTTISNSRWFLGESGLPAIVKLRTEHPADDYFPVGSMFVVSDRLRKLLTEYTSKVEYLPVTVHSRAERYNDSFYCCNILDTVDCFDHKKGEFTYFERSGRVDKIIRFAIDKSAVRSHHLFTIARGGESIVCVSDELATAIEDAGITGVRFVDVADWPAM